MQNFEQLRAQLKKQTQQTYNNIASSIFSFKNLKIGDTVRIRFVDDGEQQLSFWRPRCYRSIPFETIRQANGEVVQKKCWVDVPAFNKKFDEIPIIPDDYVYTNDEDVINQKTKNLWNEGPRGQELYRKFKRRKSYILQGFIRSDGYDKNKLYRFVFSEELMKIIISLIDSGEISISPSDVDHGIEFLLNVTGKTAVLNGITEEKRNYATSTWARRESPLTTEERESLIANPPFVLKDFIFSKPTPEQEQIMLEMYDASYNEEPYDIVKWGKYFKPNNVSFDASGMVKENKNNQSEIPTQVAVINTVAPQQTIPTPTTTVDPIVEAPVSQETMSNTNSNSISVLQNMVNSVSETPTSTSFKEEVKQNTIEVNTTKPEDTINNLLARFGVQ